ncbi:hypothetical protein AZ048_000717 [Escherichia coli]|nr:hypothetical protein AZ048_000717 [Escherichia coli]
MLVSDLPEHEIFHCYLRTYFLPTCCWDIQIIPNPCCWGITKSTSPDVAKSRHITAKYFQPERILSVVVNAAQRTRVKVEADSRPSVDTHPSGVQPSPGTGRHPAPQLYAVCCLGGTSLYPCFRLVPSFLQNREEHHRTTGS